MGDAASVGRAFAKACTWLIPEAGLLLILGVDTFVDMGPPATNAVGNSIASAVVAKWEGALMTEAEARANLARTEAEQAAPVVRTIET